MKKQLFLTLVFSALIFNAIGQINNKNELLFELTKLYSKYSITKNPTDNEIQNIKGCDLYQDNEFLVNLVLELVLPNNSTINPKFLRKPNLEVVNDLYAVNQLSILMHSYTKEDIMRILESNINRNFDKYVLLENFYSMCFHNIGNKYGRLNLTDLSDINYNLDSLGLENDTEKAIFFLHYIRWCNTYVASAYPKKQNNGKLLKESLDYFNSYPTINEKKYFYYRSFDMKPIPLKVNNVSFKEYYLQLYGQFLSTHLKCCKYFNDIKTYNEILDSSIINMNEYKSYLDNVIVPDTILI